MGLEKGGRTGVQYLKVSDGKLRIKSNEEDPEAEKRVVEVNGEKHILYEKTYSRVSGFITEIQLQEHDQYGTSLNVIVEDEDGGAFQLQMAEKSRYFQHFAMMLPNIDFLEEIIFQPYSFTPQGSQYKTQGVKLTQNGKKVPNYYKTWDADNKVNILSNGMEDYDFAACKTKKQKEILKIKLISFLEGEIEKQIERIKEVLKKFEDNSGDDSEEDLP